MGMSDLYKKWKKLGVGFAGAPEVRFFIDVEKLLMDTAKEGRVDSRLLFGMRGWLLNNHDLVNGQRLIRLIKQETKKGESTSVLGAVLDSVVREKPRSALKNVLKYCKRNDQREFVFPRIAESKVLSRLNEEENHPVWESWNLISREMEEARGVLRRRSYVLRRNKNLLVRALIGNGVKAEILNYFLNRGKGNTLEIAKAIGLSYEPVYSELQQFKDLQLIQEEQGGQGRARIFCFSPRAQKAFSLLLPKLSG